jgi:hypothetical protein
MSRAEELRAKFKAKGEAIKQEMQSPFGEFRSKLYAFVDNDCTASTTDAFHQKMFELWEKSGRPPLDAWFLNTVKPKFNTTGVSPRWRNEPSWCFLDGEPMSFVAQYDEDDTTFYVFEGRREVKDGWVRVTKMSAQNDIGIVNLDGEIIG